MPPCAMHFRCSRYSRYTPAPASPPFQVHSVRATPCHTARVLYPVFSASVFRGAFKLPSDNALPSMHCFCLGVLKGQLFVISFSWRTNHGHGSPFFKWGAPIFWVKLQTFSFLTGLKTVFRSVCVTWRLPQPQPLWLHSSPGPLPSAGPVRNLSHTSYCSEAVVSLIIS